MSMEWISVKERLPDDLCDVLVIIPKKDSDEYFVPFVSRHIGGGNFRNEEDDENDINDYSGSITHWMLLPEPPNQPK